MLVAAGAAVASAAPPPLPVSVWTSDDGVCFVVSKQVPHCVPLDAIRSEPTTAQRTGVANPIPPAPYIPMPYRHGDEICWDPSPTSKGPCINVPQP
jgi:hypothetical protein